MLVRLMLPMSAVKAFRTDEASGQFLLYVETQGVPVGTLADVVGKKIHVPDDLAADGVVAAFHATDGAMEEQVKPCLRGRLRVVTRGGGHVQGISFYPH